MGWSVPAHVREETSAEDLVDRTSESGVDELGRWMRSGTRNACSDVIRAPVRRSPPCAAGWTTRVYAGKGDRAACAEIASAVAWRDAQTRASVMRCGWS